MFTRGIAQFRSECCLNREMPVHDLWVQRNDCNLWFILWNFSYMKSYSFLKLFLLLKIISLTCHFRFLSQTAPLKSNFRLPEVTIVWSNKLPDKWSEKVSFMRVKAEDVIKALWLVEQKRYCRKHSHTVNCRHWCNFTWHRTP